MSSEERKKIVRLVDCANPDNNYKNKDVALGIIGNICDKFKLCALFLIIYLKSLGKQHPSLTRTAIENITGIFGGWIRTCPKDFKAIKPTKTLKGQPVSLLDLFAYDNKQITEIVYHPVGKYTSDKYSDEGGLWQRVTKSFLKPYNNMYQDGYIENTVSRVIETACTPYLEYDPSYASRFIFIVLLVSQESVFNLVKKTIINKKKKEYLIKYYYNYCSQVIDLLLASDFCVINASYILEFTINKLGYIWLTQDISDINKTNERIIQVQKENSKVIKRTKTQKTKDKRDCQKISQERKKTVVKQRNGGKENWQYVDEKKILDEIERINKQKQEKEKQSQLLLQLNKFN